MATIGTRQLRAELADFVRRAGTGERFVVSVGGRPVAQLGPIETWGTTGPDTLEDAARLGLVQRPQVVENMVGSEDLPVDPGKSDSISPFPADVRVDRILRQVRG